MGHAQVDKACIDGVERKEEKQHSNVFEVVDVERFYGVRAEMENKHICIDVGGVESLGVRPEEAQRYYFPGEDAVISVFSFLLNVDTAYCVANSYDLVNIFVELVQ